MGAVVAFFDNTSAAALTSLTIANTTGTFDSGALSIATTAGDRFSLRVTTAAGGCTSNPVGFAGATYQ